MSAEFCPYCVSIMQGPVCDSMQEAQKCPCYETEQHTETEKRQRQADLLATLGVTPPQGDDRG